MGRHGMRMAVLAVAWGMVRVAGGETGVSQPIRPGQPLAVRVTEDRAEFGLVRRRSSDVFLLVVGSTATDGEASEVTVSLTPADTVPPLVTASDHPGARWSRETRRLAEQLRRARHQARPAARSGARPRRRVGQARTFHVYNFTGDWDEPSSYTPVEARLAVVGRFCTIWVDTRDVVPVDRLKLVSATFDRDVLPTSRRLLGKVKDVDGDGKFAILFTGEMTRLGNGRISMGGMVIGQDFRLNHEPPLTNQCDMLYLSPAIRSASRLRTLVAHEFSHAVTMTHHALTEYLPRAAHESGDEESWLNEAMAHVAENLYGYSWGNIAFRVNTFLNAPWRYRLVVRDFRDERFWRLHGYRGGVYLFMRWCVDQHGQGILRMLQQTNLRGTQNLEVTLRRPFGALLRDWHLALWLSHRNYSRHKRYRYTYLPVPGVLDGRYLLVGPPADTLCAGGDPLSRRLVPTGARYVLLRGASRGASGAASVRRPGGAGRRAWRVCVSGSAGCGLQVSVVRLSGPVADLSVDATPTPLQADADGQVAMRLALRETAGVPVVLQQVSWEDSQEPSAQNNDTRLRPVLSDAAAIRRLFGTNRVAAGGTIHSREITVGPIGPGTRGLFVKVLGQDPKGRLVTAQHHVPVGTPREDAE